MVAMVAMPREYTENGSRQMKLSKRGGTRTRNGSSHACVTFGSWPPWPPWPPSGADLLKRKSARWLVSYHPTSFPLYLFLKFQFRGGHGGHGGHALRIHRERLSADETSGRAVRVASAVGCADSVDCLCSSPTVKAFIFWLAFVFNTPTCRVGQLCKPW